MMRRGGEWLHELVWDGTFDGQIESRSHSTAVFNAHNARVQRVAASERLLVFESSAGWEPLCAFLGVPVPDTPYPRVNSSDDYVAALKRAGLVK